MRLLLILFTIMYGTVAIAGENMHQYTEGFRYKHEPIVNGIKRDLWQSPEYTRVKGGDCEDYAVMVLFGLIESGVPESEVSLEVWSKNSSSKKHPRHHAVVKYKGKYYSNHGDHGKTVMGYTYEYTVSYQAVKQKVKKGNT